MSTSYHEFHVELLKQTYNQLLQVPPFSTEGRTEQDESFLEQFQQLVSDVEQYAPESHENGQDLVTRFVRSYPDLVPVMPRDLLWFFGGDCLHFMPDEELAKFQRLDEKMHEALSENSNFDYPRERAVILELAH